MRILFSGEAEQSWQSGWQRARALEECGHAVQVFSHGGGGSGRGLGRLISVFSGGAVPDATRVREFNETWLGAVVAAAPELVWAEWPVLLERETIERARKAMPRATFVAFQDDNPFGTRRGELARWSRFLAAVPAYDCVLVKRHSDLENFRALGAVRVVRVMHGYFKPIFRPCAPVPARWRADVSFVGTALDHRVGAVSRLLLKHGLPLRVYGTRWNRTAAFYLRPWCFRRPVFGPDYAKVISGSAINLGFVSSSNCDEYSMRSFEIPACRGFLLAERTPTHESLFEEGVEAEFFGCVEECADKIRHYLGHPEQRQRIALAGYERCFKSGYSLTLRMEQAVREVCRESVPVLDSLGMGVVGTGSGPQGSKA